MVSQVIQPPDTTLTIVLGASKWPKAPNLSAPSSFPKSALAFVDYLLSEEGFNLPAENLLNLFDTDDFPSQVVERVSTFLKDRKEALKEQNLEPSALIFYYVGHGSFSGKDYILALKSTNRNHEGATSLRMVDLAEAIQSTVSQIRRYLILDCCFAAAAYEEFQAAPLTAAVQRTTDVFPRQGTALLCASGAQDPAKAPPGETYTMFSGALLKVLREGNSTFPPIFSLREVGQLATDLVRDKYADEAVRPEVHTPEMREGDIALIPLFPNAAFRVDVPARLRNIESRLTVVEQIQRELKDLNVDLRTQFKELKASASAVISDVRIETEPDTQMPLIVSVALHRWHRGWFWGKIWIGACSVLTVALIAWVFYFSAKFQQTLVVGLMNKILLAYLVVLTVWLFALLLGGVYRQNEPTLLVVRLFSRYPRPKPVFPFRMEDVEGPRTLWVRLPEVVAASTASIVEVFTIPFDSILFYVGNAELALQLLVLFASGALRVFSK